MKATVLMSTYNGGRFLKEQIESILRQEEVKVELVIRDDCSTDNTREILSSVANNYPNVRVILGKENFGACKSFLYLISRYSDSDYTALADQDDVWDSDKLKIAIEKISSSQIPVLYHSNLRIIDESGVYIRDSHRSEQVEKTRFSFLCEPLPTGCTIVYNRLLGSIVQNTEPSSFSMHDTWLYCVCSLFGKVVYDFIPHMSYRQHSSNVIGTYKHFWNKKAFIQQANKIFSKKRPRSNNARIIYSIFADKLTSEQKEKLTKVITYRDSFHNKLILLLDKDIRPNSLLRTYRYWFKVIINTF